MKKVLSAEIKWNRYKITREMKFIVAGVLENVYSCDINLVYQRVRAGVLCMKPCDILCIRVSIPCSTKSSFVQ